MLRDGWQALFAPHILLRGKDYWRQGLVEEQTREADYVRAIVRGSEDYEVEIFLSDGEVEEQYCSCPYASDGRACKHMAAVLFSLSGEEGADGGFAEDGFDEEAAGGGWQAVLQSLTDAQARAFLEQALSENSELQRLLVLGYGPEQPVDKLTNIWCAQLRELVLSFRGSDGWIDYAHADAFYKALNRFLKARLPGLLRRGAQDAAFHLTCMVYTIAMHEEADSSDGGMSLLADTCRDAWKTILSGAPAARLQDYRDWFAAQLKERAHSLGIEEIEALLFGFDWDETCLQKNLALLDELLASDQTSEYQIPTLLQQREDTMRALGRSEAEIDAFWDAFCAARWSQPSVRDKLLRRLLDDQNYPAAIAQLLKERTLSPDDTWRQRRCSDQLIELYHLTGQEDAYRNELLLQLKTWPQQNLDNVRALRDITPEGAWPSLFEKLLAFPGLRPLRLELLESEQQWDRLYDELDRQNELLPFERYVKPLTEWNLEKTLALFSRLCDARMAHASNRNMYQDVLCRASALNVYPGGEALFSQLLTNWQAQYPRRSAMQDEIKKLQKRTRRRKTATS